MKKLVSVVAGLGLILAVGCAQESTTDNGTASSADSVAGSQYLLDEEPTGAQDVVAAREGAKDGDDVLVVGRIGGSGNPWIEGKAAFSIVDGSLKACSDIPGDQCETPWDYCCETDKLPSATALVKVVDDDGDLVKTDARDLLKVKPLSTVVVRGKAQRDDAGNLTVLARGVYVKK
jgi:hypothetical protein